MSSILWWLVLGLLIGWLVEWVIDWLYWRRRQVSTVDTQADIAHAQMRDSLASARADNMRLRIELDAATALAQQRQATIDAFAAQRAQLGASDTQLAVGLEAAPPSADRSAEDRATAESLATVQRSHENVVALTLPADQAAVSGPITSDTQILEERALPQPAERRRDPLIEIKGIGPAYERKLFDAGVSTFDDLAALTTEQVRVIIAPQPWQEIDPAAWIVEARQFAQKKAEQ